jgi:2-polyprenyl-6-methoxyphenol hydroxylase-like FAD-dependent oxidoreductase
MEFHSVNRVIDDFFDKSDTFLGHFEPKLQASVYSLGHNHWYQGHAALVGEACQCLTLLAGQGAAMGMAGVYLLAEELHQADGDYKVAFPAYQQKLKPEIDRRQEAARGLAGSFVPRNNFEISMAYLFFNLALLPRFSSLFAKQIERRA